MKKNGILASFGGAFAGLCCAGIPVVLAFLSGIGFGFLINYFILFPLLFVSLGFMFYSLKHNKKAHLSTSPIFIAILSTILILVGIFFRPVVWIGVIGLFTATIWDFMLIKRYKKC